MSSIQAAPPPEQAYAPVTPPRTLEQCEAAITRGLETFIEVGEALAEIRDRELYKETHATWETAQELEDITGVDTETLLLWFVQQQQLHEEGEP